LIDGVIIFVTLWISSFVHIDNRWADDYWPVSIMAIVLFYLFASLSNLYGHWRSEALTREYSRVLSSWIGAFVFLLVMASAMKTTVHYSRIVFFSWAGLAPLVMCLWHRYLYDHAELVPFSQREIVRVVIAGVDDYTLQVARFIERSNTSHLKFMGFYDDDDSLAQLDHLKESGFRHLGGLKDMEKDAQVGSYHLVYLNAKRYKSLDVSQWVRKLSDSTACVYLLMDDSISPFSFAPHIHNFGKARAVSLYERPFKGWQLRVKRVEDVTISALILLLIAMPMLLIALAIKLTSRGPIIFAQRRYGEGGRPFKMYKFRSMTVAEDGEQVIQAQKGDARVTTLGKFLRRRSLDELPQFVNVLKGDMSIVGPRPHASVHNEFYRKKILGYMLRHKVKPGITGLAQISGSRGLTATEASMRKRIEFDLQYIEHWSLWLDLKIIFINCFKGFNDPDAF
jgi:putative colanic acid biosynthesis UDP-glucose lipid carrier transferase